MEDESSIFPFGPTHSVTFTPSYKWRRFVSEIRPIETSGLLDRLSIFEVSQTDFCDEIKGTMSPSGIAQCPEWKMVQAQEKEEHLPNGHVYCSSSEIVTSAICYHHNLDNFLCVPTVSNKKLVVLRRTPTWRSYHPQSSSALSVFAASTPFPSQGERSISF
jgi:hypothetical protein